MKPHVLPWALFSHKAKALRYRHTEVAEREKLSIPGRGAPNLELRLYTDTKLFLLRRGRKPLPKTAYRL